MKVQDRSYLASFHIKNLSTLQKAPIQVLPIQVKNSELICKDRWNLGLLDLCGFQVRRHFSFHPSWCLRGAASCRVQAQAMTSVHPAHSTPWNSSSWPPTTCLGSIPISLASHDSELLQCVGAVSDSFIHVFWLQTDEASSSHRFLRGIQFLWEKFIDTVKQCQPLPGSEILFSQNHWGSNGDQYWSQHKTSQESQVGYFICPLWSNTSFSVLIIGVLHSRGWTHVVSEGQNHLDINGRRCFPKQPSHLRTSSVLSLKDDGQLSPKEWNWKRSSAFPWVLKITDTKNTICTNTTIYPYPHLW